MTIVVQEKEIVQNFEKLRQRIEKEGLMKERPLYFYRKVAEIIGFMTAAFVLQYYSW